MLTDNIPLMIKPMQVFFAPDNVNLQWSVVLQKEPRSRRVEEDNDDGVLGAPGFATPVTLDDVGASVSRNAGGPVDVGIEVPLPEVDVMNAQRENDGAAEPINEMDHVDEDLDSDTEMPTDGWHDLVYAGLT